MKTKQGFTLTEVIIATGIMNAGGAETYLMKLYRNIDVAKFQMDFCVNVYEHNYYEDEIISRGGRFFRIPSRTKNLLKHNMQLKRTNITLTPN